MPEGLYLPLNDPGEIRRLLVGFPAVVDPSLFVDFVLGFPRRYLVQTPKVDVVKHFLLAQSLAQNRVITSLAQERGRWKLSVMTRDRSFLFARISGALSCYGMNILAAEAFANAHNVVLDTFHFEDRPDRFRDPSQRQSFQSLLEEVVSGEVPIEPLLEKKWPDIACWEEEELGVSFDNAAFPGATLMQLRCRDRFGLLYLVSHFLSERGYSIEMAYIRTRDHEADDEFYLTRDGRIVEPQEFEQLEREFKCFRVPRFLGAG